MARVLINASLEYLMGHLRYGHREGVLEIPDDELNDFEANPEKYCEKYYDDISYMDLIVDDYRVEDVGPISEITYEIL